MDWFVHLGSIYHLNHIVEISYYLNVYLSKDSITKLSLFAYRSFDQETHNKMKCVHGTLWDYFLEIWCNPLLIS